MRKFKLSLITLLLVNSSYADTKSVHFDVGDLAPRQKITINMDTPKWPGYHDIKCDIIDPSYSAIIRISSDDSFAEIIKINEAKYNNLPLQVSLKEQKNQLTLYKTYNLNNEEENNITFENLDDDVTISIKNCEISPNAILSKDLMYFPSAVTCAAGTCKVQGGQEADWAEVTGLDGVYTFNTAYYGYETPDSMTGYYNGPGGTLMLRATKNVKPYMDIYTAWSVSAPQMSCYSSAITACPLKDASSK